VKFYLNDTLAQYTTYTNVPQVAYPKQPPVVQVQPAPPRQPNAFWSWIWEIFTALLCLGLLAAIAAILARYNGQRVPDWGLSINLSTLIALLATVLRASLVLIAAQVISQAKWNWFSGSQGAQPLQLFQDFDAASRSAISALLLIPRLVLRSPATLTAALITIASYATGPFVQQAIKTVDCDRIVPTLRTSIPVAHYIPGSSDYFRLAAGQWSVKNDMKAVSIDGLSNPSTANSTIVASCPTGNCTFSEYATVGLCSACKDASSLITGPHRTNSSRRGEWRLPNGGAVGAERGLPSLALNFANNLSWVPNFPADAAWAAYNFTILAAADDMSNATAVACKLDNLPGDCKFTASACALYPCMRTYSGNVSSGLFTETPVSTVPLLPDIFNNTGNGSTVGGPFYPFPNTLYPYSAVYTPCVVNGKTYTTSNISTAPGAVPMVYYTPSQTRVETSAPISCIYRMDELYPLALSNYFGWLLSGNCTNDSQQAGSLRCLNDGFTTDKFWLDSFFFNWTATPEKIAGMVETLAVAVTSKMRLTGKTAALDNVPLPERGVIGDATQGEVWTTTICTDVDWPWLALPAALVLMALAVLVTAFIQNWRRPVWKASVLPVILYGDRFLTPEGQSLQGVAGTMTLPEMEKATEQTNVRFVPNTEVEQPTSSQEAVMQQERSGDAYVDSWPLREENRG